ncbi:MAG: anti-sigma regulatory factor [Phycisphaerae bacterium]|nr:anti-sigma regulatory factor [Phycisphaerae bacterium]
MAACARVEGIYDKEHSLRDEREQIDAFKAEFSSLLASHGYSEACVFGIRLAFEEGLVNAFRHGNENDPDKPVRITYSIDSTEVHLQLEDQGAGFDPESVPDPTREENLEIPSGRGIMLMRAYMSEVVFIPPGNKLRMRYCRPDSK